MGRRARVGGITGARRLTGLRPAAYAQALGGRVKMRALGSKHDRNQGCRGGVAVHHAVRVWLTTRSGAAWEFRRACRASRQDGEILGEIRDGHRPGVAGVETEGHLPEGTRFSPCLDLPGARNLTIKSGLSPWGPRENRETSATLCWWVRTKASHRLRRAWREGLGPRRTRVSRAPSVLSGRVTVLLRRPVSEAETVVRFPYSPRSEARAV
jgi:hypothetical protein